VRLRVRSGRRCDFGSLESIAAVLESVALKGRAKSRKWEIFAPVHGVRYNEGSATMLELRDADVAAAGLLVLVARVFARMAVRTVAIEVDQV
jgi:hypothetical protein